MSHETPDTPELSETELREMKVHELRDRAREEGVASPSTKRKEELVDAISEVHGDAGQAERGEAGQTAGASDEAGPDNGRVRTGDHTSKSIRYSQEVTSPDDEPERTGRSLVTTNHQVIRDWAEQRGGVPATVEGTEHGEHLGVLRFDFGGENDRLRHVSWEDWFETFDARRLNFLYQQERSDGRQSTFFRLESPDREDA